MPGRIILEGHTCDTPDTRKHEQGTVWQCDCGRYWRLVRRPSGGVGWEPFSAIAVAVLRTGQQIAANQAKGSRP